MKIASFTKTETGAFTGEIKTLTLDVEITLEPVSNKTKERAPDYRVISETGAECGAAWNEVSKEQKPYISLKIDDPALPDTIWANLSRDEDGSYTLYWDRPKAKPQTGEFGTL